MKGPLIAAVWLALCLSARATEAVWQWSVPMGEGRAYLWIPEHCDRVRAVVLAQDNMIEPGLLERPDLRRTLADLGFAAVLVSPPFDRVFDFRRGAGERVQAMLEELAQRSGYGELAAAPVAPVGHSACASFPWNFAAWAPERTLAILSLKGDAPQTDLTGSGAPNPPWDGRHLAGIPGLFVMSEQEWWEDRLAPLVRFRDAFPATPLAVLCDSGHGHFDATEQLAGFVALFLRKAAAARLPQAAGGPLRPVGPLTGALARRWSADGALGSQSFWCFDEEMARLTEAIHGRGADLRPQQVDFVQDGRPAPIATTHTGVELVFQPEGDGLTFALSGTFIAPLPAKPPLAAKDRPPPPVTVQPVPAAPGSHAAGPVQISVIAGPARQIGPELFRVEFNRTSQPGVPRGRDVWLLARHPGDAVFGGAVQQARLRLPEVDAGATQAIEFAPVADRPANAAPFALEATSSAGLPVGVFVREGPAFVRDGVLHLTPLPPRAKFPVRVTLVAWQPGRSAEPRVRAAPPVERSFLLSSP